MNELNRYFVLTWNPISWLRPYHFRADYIFQYRRNWYHLFSAQDIIVVSPFSRQLIWKLLASKNFKIISCGGEDNDLVGWHLSSPSDTQLTGSFPHLDCWIR